MPDFSYLQKMPTIIIALVLFLLIFAGYLSGFRLRKKTIDKNKDATKIELGSINGTLLGLLGLMLAFTFGMANNRFDTRRTLIIEEANDIGTVILRTSLLPDSISKPLQQKLQAYVTARINYYKYGSNIKKVMESYATADSVSAAIWAEVAAYSQQENNIIKTSEIVPALNDMIDITTTRQAASESTIPDSILYFLLTLCCCAAFLLGYDNTYKIDWVVVSGLAIILSATVFTIIDLDRPRSGLINLDMPNKKIEVLLKMFDK